MFSFFLDLMKFIYVGLILLLICTYETSSFFYISKTLSISDPDYQDFIQRLGQSKKNIEIDTELFKSPEVKDYLEQKVLEKLSEMKKEKLRTRIKEETDERMKEFLWKDLEDIQRRIERRRVWIDNHYDNDA